MVLYFYLSINLIQKTNFIALNLIQVLEVKCQTRRSPDNFVSIMRHFLHKHYGKDKFIGLGGVFVIEEGKAKIHIMVSILTNELAVDSINFNTLVAFFVSLYCRSFANCAISHRTMCTEWWKNYFAKLPISGVH